MRRKCDAAITKNLTLRGRMYYYRTDYKTSDGKRHAFRRSLGTSDFLTAVALVKKLNQRILMENFDAALKLIDNMPKIGDNMSPAEMLRVMKLRQELRNTAAQVCGGPTMQLVFTPEQANQAMYGQIMPNTVVQVAPAQNVAVPYGAVPANISQPASEIGKKQGVSIRTMVDDFASSKRLCDTEQKRQLGWISSFVTAAGLSLDDDFGVFADRLAVSKIGKWILESKNQQEWKRKNAGLLSRLLIYARDAAPVPYNIDSLGCVPKIHKNSVLEYQESQGFRAFTDGEFKRLFSVEYNYFDENPDLFWACLIAMYTGSRRNAVMTLQYKNILWNDDIPCIQFVPDHVLKKLKTGASIRLVPIHPQLLKLGFIKWLQKRKTRLGASDDDFIFPSFVNTTGTLDSHFNERFAKILKKAGIKTAARDGKTFHSFRDSLSVLLAKSGINDMFANKICGWQGAGTRGKHYADVELRDIAAIMPKFNYDEIMPLLRYRAERLWDK